MFSILFDKNYGALYSVRKYVPAGSELIITGHSRARRSPHSHMHFYFTP